MEEVREAWAKYVQFFNAQRPHQSFGGWAPKDEQQSSTYSLLIHVWK
ncbi:MAG: hypothetical protein KA120_09855 [Candidatus Goldbacteria bacterium]|nr:hypothetical protein [Candidatus Goldiibacteriota bacterium]